MVEEGIGVAVMSSWQARPYLSSGTIKAIRISKNGLQRKWFVASLKNERPKYLNNFVQKLVMGLPGGGSKK
jgi:LysR family transcriptional regulator, regulator for metE and metH